MACPIVAAAYLAAVVGQMLSARPERVWLLAVLPIIAVLIDGRTRGVVIAALCELAVLGLVHALVTLIRATRLEGG